MATSTFVPVTCNASRIGRRVKERRGGVQVAGFFLLRTLQSRLGSVEKKGYERRTYFFDQPVWNN